MDATSAFVRGAVWSATTSRNCMLISMMWDARVGQLLLQLLIALVQLLPLEGERLQLVGDFRVERRHAPAAAACPFTHSAARLEICARTVALRLHSKGDPA